MINNNTQIFHEYRFHVQENPVYLLNIYQLIHFFLVKLKIFLMIIILQYYINNLIKKLMIMI